MSAAMKSVIEVARAMGMELSPAMAWTVGTVVANRYREIYGSPPVKDLRQKTNGGGSHCFALYPASFVPVIEAAIKAAGAQRNRQPSLF